MKDIRDALLEIANKARDFGDQAKKVSDACFQIGKSWSGSSLVGHAKYFFGDFEEPSTPQRFSIEWGLINGVPRGWAEKSADEVRSRIESVSGVSLDTLKTLETELETSFQDIQRKAVLASADLGLPDNEVEKLEKYSPRSLVDIFNDLNPTRFVTRDRKAMTGTYIAPHIYYDALARYITSFPSEVDGYIFELDKLSRKKVATAPATQAEEKKSYYVDSSVIKGLSEIKSDKFDLSKLIKLCRELNDNYSLENYLSCGMLIRAILDHIPPIFGKSTFTEVANNHGSKSFKDIVLPLENSARKISDFYLHHTIRKKELIPNKTQVGFQPNMDVLLSEVIRILSE